MSKLIAMVLSSLFATGLLSSFHAIAEQPPMQAPMAPKAIESHLEQKRTLEQREAIEVKKNQAAKPAAPASAVSDCESKAIDKNGKPLAGAAKASSIKKCESEASGKK